VLPVRAISCKIQKRLKWNLVYKYMAVRGMAVNKNHNFTLNILV